MMSIQIPVVTVSSPSPSPKKLDALLPNVKVSPIDQIAQSTPILKKLFEEAAGLI